MVLQRQHNQVHIFNHLGPEKISTHLKLLKYNYPCNHYFSNKSCLFRFLELVF
jgi:hypothetical protein